MEFLIFLAVLAAVVVFVTRPLWRAPAEAAKLGAAPASTELADLEAARDAKYREIRDAELDHRTGKLSHEDFELIDRSLRAEALEILRQLDRARGGPAAAEGDRPQEDAPRSERVVPRAERLPSP
jgi:hypothetical protein